MGHRFDKKQLVDMTKQLLSEYRQELQRVVSANSEKDPRRFSYTYQERIDDFPVVLEDGSKLCKRKYVNIVRKACNGTEWHVVVRGNMLKAKLRGDRL